MTKLLTGTLLALLFLGLALPAAATGKAAKAVTGAGNQLLTSMNACQKAKGGVLNEKALGGLQAAVRKLEGAIEALVEHDAKGLGGDEPASLACKYETDFLYDDVVQASNRILSGVDPNEPRAFCTYLGQIQPLIKKRVQAFTRCVNDL
jgi:hypothetical protein